MVEHKSSLDFQGINPLPSMLFWGGWIFNFVLIFQQYSKKEDFSFPTMFLLLMSFVFWLILCHKSTPEFLLLSLVNMNAPV